MTLKLYLFEGLCNRVNGIASALATGMPVEVYWAVNVHCPVAFEDLFAAPLDGVVSVRNDEVDNYLPYRRSAPDYCYFYPTNIAGQSDGDYRSKMRAAYDRIFACLFDQEARLDDQPSVGLSFRRHFPLMEVLPWQPFIRHVCADLTSQGVEHVWVSSDAQEEKDAMVAHLEKRGIRCSFHTYGLLRRDLDRSPDQIRAFVRDLQGLHACREFYLNNARTTICDRFFFSPDVRLNFVFDDRDHRTRYDGAFYEHPGVHVVYQPGLLKQFLTPRRTGRLHKKIAARLWHGPNAHWFARRYEGKWRAREDSNPRPLDS